MRNLRKFYLFRWCRFEKREKSYCNRKLNRQNLCARRDILSIMFDKLHKYGDLWKLSPLIGKVYGFFRSFLKTFDSFYLNLCDTRKRGKVDDDTKKYHLLSYFIEWVSKFSRTAFHNVLQAFQYFFLGCRIQAWHDLIP